MATYRLLRNNKESGPHSVDDLKQMGLKAYDLVWIDGKSAAWRYPGEVEELQSFAPQVEEQPYDRFYKKQSDEKKIETPPQEAEKPVQSRKDAYAVAPEHEKYVPKKSVFVTMPGKKNHTSKPAVVPQETVKPVAPPVQQKAVPLAEKPISVTENPVAAQVKYSQPLDEIKEMYVKTLHDRKQKIARKTFWLQSLKKAAVIALLIAIGVLAGLFIQSKNNTKKILAGSQQSLPGQSSLTNNAPPAVTDPGSVLPPNAANTALIDATTKQQSGENNFATEDVAENKQTPGSREKVVHGNNAATDKKIINSPAGEEENNSTMSPGISVDPSTGERGRRTRTDNSMPAERERERKSFSGHEAADQVSVKSNDYKRVAFGGIRNLELTVTNDSKYTLDNVIVELQYIKPNELPLKTEKIEFKSIGPKSTSTVRIPDTNRGIKVTYRIINISSRQMDEVATGN